MYSGGKNISQDEITEAPARGKMHVESPQGEPGDRIGSNYATSLMTFKLLHARWGHVWPATLGKR